jgi:choline dehydrogenase-like flavoprotein
MSATPTDDGVDRTPVDDADVCVVGAGPAGAHVAHRLAVEGHDVVILEAGEYFDMESRVDRMKRQIHPDRGADEIWDMGGDRDAYTSSGEQEIPLNRRRVKGVGGTSLHWGSVSPRLREKDFEMRTRHGVGVDWPISYSDLQPYYAEAEQEVGVTGPNDAPHQPPREEEYPMDGFDPSYTDQLFAEAGDAIDVDVQTLPMAINTGAYDRNECQGYGTCEHVCPSGAKYTAEIHVELAVEHGATVIDQVPVQRLEHGPDGETVTDAVYVAPDGTEHRQTADVFVAAAGAYETPRLLLLSDSDQYPDGLANSSGTVGRYFMDHPTGGVTGVLVDQETHQGAYGPVVSSGIYQFYEGEELSERGAVNIMLINVAGPSPATLAMQQEAVGDDLLNAVDAQYGNTIGLIMNVEMLPRADNRITLDESTTDDNGNPVPDISLSAGEYALNAAEQGLQVGRDLLEEMGANVLFDDSNLTMPNDQQPPALKGGYHPLGGTRMGTDPSESVVDENLKTHDLDNLYIAGGGVFPTAGAANPTLTIMALSRRCGEYIHENEL